MITDQKNINVNGLSLKEVLTLIQSNSPVGELKSFATYKDRSAQGFLPLAFNNAVSQVGEYADLFAEVGHSFNSQHVDSGDADLSDNVAGMFYPTPTPGRYGRSAIPDLNIDGVTLALPTNFRDGTLFLVKSGTDQTADTELFIRRVDANTVSYHSTEAEAIDDTSPITVTGSGVLTQEGIVLDHASESMLENSHYHNGGNLSRSAAGLYAPYGSVSGPTTKIDDSAGATLGSKYHKTNTVTHTHSPESGKTSNESRGTTFYKFEYIKAKYIYGV